MALDINDYDYKLPNGLIANYPSSKRDNCKLLCLNKKTNQTTHHYFYNLVDLLGPNDVLVLNQSKVFSARIFGKKESGGDVEFLLIRQLKPDTWVAISKPRPKIGKKIIFDNDLIGEIIKSNAINGQIEIKFNYKNIKFYKILSKIGHTPLPSYINSSHKESQLRTEYQTVFATKVGSAAAPTAGLHFTKNLLFKLKKRGVQLEYITLHVGLGTFQNLRPENIKSKTLHTEFYEIDVNTAKHLNLAKKEGKRIIAVGTTTVRTLESAIRLNGKIKAGNQATNIFIYPPFKFKFVDCLITNFHLPKSSLLMLVSAFAGKNKIITAYHNAIKNKYRFFSFGDAMFIY